MGDPYIGEIRMFAGNFAPAGWQFCDGSLLAISDNDALFSLIGATYGGDGQTTFAIPDLRGRAPLHNGQGPGLGNHVIGEVQGVESVTITNQTMPAHTHPLMASTDGADQITGAAGVVAAPPSLAPYYTSAPDPTPLNPAALAAAGGSQPHDNMQPFLAVSFIISLFGIYPSRP